MSFLGKLLGHRKDDEITRIRKIMGTFIGASFLGRAHPDRRGADQEKIVLLYMLGALDMLCQAHKQDAKTTLTLFESLLKGEELGGYSDEEAQVLLNGVVKASDEQDGKELMDEGAEALRTWLIGENVAAPHRLTEILMERTP